jgi:hypothetical protein
MSFRLERERPPNLSPRHKDKVAHDSTEDIRHTSPHIPPSPLTPLTPSPQVPDTECEKVGVLESGVPPPQQHIPDKSRRVSSIPPPHEPAATPHPKLDVPVVEGPTSDEDENIAVLPSPVCQPLLQSSNPPAGRTPSASTRRHLRISHAKLRSLSAATVELDSDGEEMSSDTSIDVFPSSPGVSCPATSYLDLNGTLPSEVGDFLDMVGTNASSDT